MSGPFSAMAPDLARALSFRTWAAFFAGMMWLSSGEQLAVWLGLHPGPPWFVFLAALLVQVVCRGLAAAAARRWRRQSPLNGLEIILQPRGDTDGE